MTDHVATIRALLKDAVPVGARPYKPPLRLVQPAKPPVFDSVTRDSMLGRIRDLRRMYGLGWLVRQETFDIGPMECLEDRALSALLHDMERARECLRDDVSFEDAGLLRSNCG